MFEAYYPSNHRLGIRSYQTKKMELIFPSNHVNPMAPIQTLPTRISNKPKSDYHKIVPCKEDGEWKANYVGLLTRTCTLGFTLRAASLIHSP